MGARWPEASAPIAAWLMRPWQMHRNHLAGLIAVFTPWTFTSGPGVAVALLPLFYLRSVTAWVAVAGAAIIYDPRLAWLAIPALPVLLWFRHRYPPGALGDSVRSRLLGWLYLVRDWSWRPRGAGAARIPLEHAHVRSRGLAVCGAPAHNEWLEFAYEWGLPGLLVVLGGLTAMALNVRTHDRLSASVIAAGLILTASSPLRAFVGWLRGGRARLFDPALRCTITIHLDWQGRAFLYVPNAEHDADLQARVGSALVKLGEQWCTAHRIVRQ